MPRATRLLRPLSTLGRMRRSGRASRRCGRWAPARSCIGSQAAWIAPPPAAGPHARCAAVQAFALSRGVDVTTSLLAAACFAPQGGAASRPAAAPPDVLGGARTLGGGGGFMRAGMHSTLAADVEAAMAPATRPQTGVRCRGSARWRQGRSRLTAAACPSSSALEPGACARGACFPRALIASLLARLAAGREGVAAVAGRGILVGRGAPYLRETLERLAASSMDRLALACRSQPAAPAMCHWGADPTRWPERLVWALGRLLRGPSQMLRWVRAGGLVPARSARSGRGPAARNAAPRRARRCQAAIRCAWSMACTAHAPAGAG